MLRLFSFSLTPALFAKRKDGIIPTMEIVIVAMPLEAQPILDVAHIEKERRVGYAVFYELTYHSRRFVLAVSGIGKAFSAAACEAALLLYPNASDVINIGVAGSNNPVKAPLFSIIVATHLVEHDLDTSAIGDPVGLVSGINLVELPTDSALRARLEQGALSLGLPFAEGVITSGDTFYSDKENKRRLFSKFASLGSDMEGAPIAQIAFVHQVPYACLRVISDADNPGEEYPQNAKKAASIAASIFLKTLEA